MGLMDIKGVIRVNTTDCIIILDDGLISVRKNRAKHPVHCKNQKSV